jgi:predicted RNA-binding Zn-ribbon protein involved in translation (DUF1610 family)
VKPVAAEPVRKPDPAALAFAMSIFMARHPRKVEVEIEVICPSCGYHLRRTAARLRRDTPVICANCGEQVMPPPPRASTVRNRR